MAATALFGVASAPAADPRQDDDVAAVRYSQAAIGRQLANYTLLDRSRRPVDLDSYRGRPLVVNLIYTSCYHTCPLIAQNLVRAVAVARESLGQDSFRVVTIGFDARADTPERMAAFARSQGLDAANWDFLSADAPTIDRLTENLGFIFYASTKGFDHLAQTTVIDAEGQIYHHIYGSEFDPPQLVEPLKNLRYGRMRALTSWDGIVNSVKLFCTIYDPSLGRYRFDYRVVILVVVGGLTMLAIGFVVGRAWWRYHRVGDRA